MNWPTIALGFTVAVALQAPASASCGDVRGNVVPNCGFEVGDPPASWTGTGSFQRSDVPRSGAHSASATTVGTATMIHVLRLESACMPLPQPGEYAFGVYARAAAPVADCFSNLFSYADEACLTENGVADSAGVLPSPDRWQPVAGSGPVTGPFARLEVVCLGNLPAAEPDLFDDAFVTRVEPSEIPALTPIGAALLTLVLALSGPALLASRRPPASVTS